MKLINKIPTGIQKIYNTNVEDNHNYIAHGICNHNCVIDADYEGEVHINLHNVGNETQIINPGDKIAQFILLKVNLANPVEYNSLESLYGDSTSERGANGFGSTGAN